MQRIVYERSPIEGFRSQRVESIAYTPTGRCLFAGTSDGALNIYQLTDSENNRSSCALIDNIRKQSKDKKPISSLFIVETWKILIGIFDGVIAVYDIQSNYILTQLNETKGCVSFAVNEKSYIMTVALKKKLLIFAWQGTNFILRKEILVQDTPKVLTCVSNSIIVGYKRHYEVVDILTSSVNRLVEVEKEHRMVCLELLPTHLRQHSMILSVGQQGLGQQGAGQQAIVHQGVVVSIASVPSSTSSVGNDSHGHGASYGERIEWAGAPLALFRGTPFILSLLADAVEIHDEATLTALQRLPMPSSVSGFSAAVSVFSMCMAIRPNSPSDHAVLCSGDAIFYLRMVPLASQIATLVEASLYEDALNICALCNQTAQLRDLDVGRIHEKFAYSLFLKGDFDEAINNYIVAKANPVQVLLLFPDFIPLALQGSERGRVAGTKGSSGSGQVTGKFTGSILLRAAAAVVRYCEHHRAHVTALADKGEKILNSGIGSSLMDDDVQINPAEAIRTSEMLDSALLSALVQSSPPKRAAVIDMLSKPNRCHIESSAVLLASQGNSFTEPLLWLYRSHNEHKRVLNALTEERCVGSGAWNREEFYKWTADCLRSLWFHDATLAPLVLQSLKQVLEFDAELGLSVLTQPETPVAVTSSGDDSHVAENSNSTATSANVFGGRGVTVAEVVAFLETVLPNSKPSTAPKSTVANIQTQYQCPLNVAGVVFPLTSGKLLGAAYLEWLVSSGMASSPIHDEYVQLLMQGIPTIQNIADSPNANSLEPDSSDEPTIMLYKIYRRKLQHFLQESNKYNPERAMKFLPPAFLHEFALILSKLNKHEEVLRIYVHQLNDVKLAEVYCNRIYTVTNATSTPGSSSSSNSNVLSGEEGGHVYVCLFKVILTPPLKSSTDFTSQITDEKSKKSMIKIEQRRNLVSAIHLAEKYFDRFDSIAFLDLLPFNTPLSLISKYLAILIEFTENKKKNLQIVYQLLRVREVNIRTAGLANLNNDSL